MQEAIAAAAGERPSPNPRVGAVVVAADGSVAGRGAHQAVGQPHAERIALAEAGARATGGILVVSLEPCVHTGRTPPCTAAIIAAGIERVVVGALDPDRRVAGAGIDRLRAAGLTVETGLLGPEAEAVDPAYFHHRRTGRPLVTLKWAATLDGAVAALDGTSQWITTPAAREDSHRLRADHDAVMVGAGTVRADDPRLDVRLPDFAGRQPRPVVIAGDGPVTGAVFERDPLVFASAPMELPAGEVIVLPGDGGVDVEKAIVTLGERDVLSVLVEGGPTLAASLWEAGLVDRGVLYLGARMAGGAGRGAFQRAFATLADAVAVENVAVRQIGADLRIDFELGER